MSDQDQTLWSLYPDLASSEDTQVTLTLTPPHSASHYPPLSTVELFMWCDSSPNLNPNILGASNPEKTPLATLISHTSRWTGTHTHCNTHRQRRQPPQSGSNRRTHTGCQIDRIHTNLMLRYVSCQFIPLALWQDTNAGMECNTHTHILFCLIGVW